MSATKTPSKNAAPLPMGTLLANRYRLQSVLGRGTVGAAYKALDEYTKSIVCIKVLAALGMQEQQLDERLRRELLVSRKVSHSNLCRVFDLQREGELLFLVMEYVEGETLLSRMKSDRAISQDEAMRIVFDAASALSCAHDKGIVHRDIKPDNIMLAKDGRTVVLDFGIALDAEHQRLTKAGIVLGSTRYIAPEVWLGETPTGKSDVFALGVLLFALLTKRHPYSGEELFRVLSSGQTCAAPSGRLYAKMSEELDAVVQKAISVSVDERFQSASELALALKALWEPKRTPKRKSSKRSKVLRPTQDCADETSPRRKNVESMSQIERAVLQSVFEAATSALDLSNVSLPKLRDASPAQAATQEHTFVVTRPHEKARTKRTRWTALVALASLIFVSAPALEVEPKVKFVEESPRPHVAQLSVENTLEFGDEVSAKEAQAPIESDAKINAPEESQSVIGAELCSAWANQRLASPPTDIFERSPRDALAHLGELVPAPKFVSAFSQKELARRARKKTRVKSVPKPKVRNENSDNWRELLTEFNQRYDRMSAEQRRRADPVMKLVNSRISQKRHKRALRLLKHALSVFKA